MEILLILSLILFLLKKPSNVLYCGIFAWTGDSNKKFSWDKFNLLGVLNNYRGGDSCGRASGNIFQYGTKKNSDYEDFLEEYENFTIKERIIIGHDRKASLGYSINKENTQPVVLKEDDKIVFILAHNGTIYNINDLAKKYNVKTTSETDSWILANIIYNYGFEVLKEYEGSASLVIYDRKRSLETGDTYMYIYKGESKNNDFVKYTSEERPLYAYKKTEGSIYLSSTENSLIAIGAKKNKIINLETNILVTIKNGHPIKEETKVIDRSNCIQNKRNVTNNNYYGDNYYNDYDYGEHYGGFHERPYVKNNNYENIENEILPSIYKFIDFRRGFYYTDKEKVDGVINLNDQGKITNTNSSFYYFIKGVMIKDLETYKEARTSIKDLIGNDGINKKLLKYSSYPVFMNTGSPNGNKFYTKSITGERVVFNGDLKPLFSTYKYTIKSGLCVSWKYLQFEERVFPIKENNLPAIPANTNFDEEYYENYMEDEVMGQETSIIIGDLLEEFDDCITKLRQLNLLDTTIIGNLELIQDNLLLDSNVLKCNLKLEKTWEIPF
jgi:hypothetical protein